MARTPTRSMTRDQRIAAMLARRHTEAWYQAGVALVAQREQERLERQREAALALAQRNVKPTAVSDIIDEIEVACRDARSDFPDVCEDDIARDMALAVLAQYPQLTKAQRKEVLRQFT